MRRLFLLGMSMFAAVMLGGAAQAADMPLKAPPPPPPVMYNWTGFYIGGHIGGAWADRNGHDNFDVVDRCVVIDAEFCFESNNGFGRNRGSFIGGGQVGFNYQVNQWVWGVEGQISGVSGNNNDDACGFFRFDDGTRDHLFNCRNRSGWIASIAARLGVTVGATGNWLLYVKGGGAFADSRFGVRLRDDCAAVLDTFTCDPNNFAFNNNNDNTRSGWMICAGVEYGAWGNWSWKLEYNFMDFGHRHFHFDNICLACVDPVVRDLDFNLRVSVVKFGLNYRFGVAPAAPVAARY